MELPERTPAQLRVLNAFEDALKQTILKGALAHASSEDIASTLLFWGYRLAELSHEGDGRRMFEKVLSDPPPVDDLVTARNVGAAYNAKSDLDQIVRKFAEGRKG